MHADWEGNAYFKYVFTSGTDKNERDREREGGRENDENDVFHLSRGKVFN